MFPDRLTGRTPDEIQALELRAAGELTFNELLALAGQRHAEKVLELEKMGDRPLHDPDAAGALTASARDAGRDLSLANTHLEDALTRFNSACYRIAGRWKRMDPDRAGS